MMSHYRLGEALVNAGLIDDFQLQSALGQQKKWGGRLGKALLDLGFLDETTLIKFLSEQLKFSAIDLSKSKIATQTFDALPKRVAEKYLAIPVVIRETSGKKTMVLAMADPTDLKAIDEIEFLTNYRIEPVVALESSIQTILTSYGSETTPSIEVATENQSIEMDDKSTSRIEIIHDDMDQLAVMQAEHPQGTDVENESSPVKADIEPGSASGMSKPTPGLPFEGDPSSPEDDTPLEMAPVEDDHGEAETTEVNSDAETPADMGSHDPNEDSDIYEPAETIDENEDSGIYEPAETIDDDVETDEFESAETVEDGDDFFGSSEEPLLNKAAPAAEPAEAEEITDAEHIEKTAEAVHEDDVHEAEAIHEAEHLEDAVEDTEVAEAVLEDDVHEAEAIHEAEHLEDAVEDIEVAKTVHEDDVHEAEAIHEAKHIEDAEHIEEAVAEPVDEEKKEEITQPVSEQPDLEQELQALRSEINGIKQKFEGFLMMFALKEQGKISLEKFLEEIKKL